MIDSVFQTFGKFIRQSSEFAKRKVEGRLFAVRALLRRGQFPNAIIIGSMKAGTTSLYEYLIEHPEICGARHKEIQYFDTYFHKGPNWYRASFDPQPGHKAIIEASPCTMIHPAGAKRVKDLIPHVKIIVVVRDPADRAHSHFHHARALGYERLSSFEAALAAEPDRIRGLPEQLLANDQSGWLKYRDSTFQAQGFYAKQLEHWLEFFPADSILVLKSEEMFADPQSTMDKVSDFLGLSRYALRDPSPRNQRSYTEMSPQTRVQLDAAFADQNQRFQQLTGISW